MITKICSCEICFNEAAVLEQVKKLYRNPLFSQYYVRSFTQVVFECYHHLDCKLSYFGGCGKWAEIRIIDISAMG